MTLLFVATMVVGQNVQAQTPLELLNGNTLTQESEDGPYLITTAADWDNLAEYVKAGNTCAGMDFKLTTNISVTTTLGYQTTNNKNSRKYFAGNFDGNHKTLDVTLSSENYADSEHRYCSPFAFFSGSTIQNLNVTGTITTDGQFAAGICGSALAHITILNCHVSVTINSSTGNSKNGNHGGFVGVAEEGSVFTNCWFDGRFLGTNFKYSGGFVGINKKGTSLTNCLFNPAEVDVTNASGACVFIHADTASDPLTLSNVYYVTVFGENQGEQVYVTAPTGPSYDEVICADGETYYRIVGSPTWWALQNAMQNGDSPIDLTENVVAASQDIALVVPAGKTITLNLNGYSINRNQSASVADGYVLKVEQGASLTVTGSGIITGGNNTGNVGGILNEGTLSLNSLTVSGNKTGVAGGGIYNATGATLTLNNVTVTGNRTLNLNGGYGAGLYVQGGSVTLTGSTISSNTGQNQGGGIYVNDGTVTATNCAITGNQAYANSTGGGVYLQGGTFTLNNGSITGNLGTKKSVLGAGVFVDSNAIFQIVGNPVINNNHFKNAPASVSNVYLVQNQVIDVTNMGTTAELGISMERPGTFTTGLDDQPLSIFTSDGSAYDIGYDQNGEAILGTRLTIQFDANGGTGVMDDFFFIEGSGLPIPVNEFVAPANSAFGSWNTASDASGTRYNNQASTRDIDANVTLYAVWSLPVVLDETAATAPETTLHANVTFNRTIVGKNNGGSDGHAWNTICFPFALSSTQIAEAFGENTVVKELTGVDVKENGEASLVFSPVDAIEANTPYIMQVDEGQSVYTFEDIAVTPSDYLTVTIDGVQFVGNYIYPKVMTNEGGTDYYILNDVFKYSTSRTKIKGFRAYFHIPAPSDIKSLGFSDEEVEEPTGISSMVNGQWSMDNAEVYDLCGRRVQQPTKGLYIINGKTVFIR